MASQPLVASFYVDYLSHPLSSEHLLVCYQQITRQIAHAPLSAKDAAFSFQHQSQAMIELLGQHQTLAVPQTKERPAPVGCRSQLKRMQNALWRRSSQSSLAKDVALVPPESLNWQKECDVLWLYGPLYNATQPNGKRQQYQQEQCDWTTFSPYSPPRRASSSLSVDGLGAEIESLAIANEMATESATTITNAKAATVEVGEEEQKEPQMPVSHPTFIEAQSSPAPSLSSESVSLDAIVTVATAVPTTTTSTSMTTTTTTTTLDTELGADPQATALLSTETAAITPLQIDTSAITAAAVKDDASSSPSSIVTSPSIEENALHRPQKSALKQLGTMSQTFEELRSFTQTPQYLALADALASFSLSSTGEEGAAASLAFADGTRSEPMSPIALGGDNATFLLPIFPAPTKYHFRSHDQRRASFPKSTSHPSQLNVNINLNMNVSVHSASATNCRRATIGGSNNSGSDHHHRHHRGGRLVPSASAKQLRFSLEVQELIFLPTSPPFRISRAKPTRAHSDPAIQTASCSSFIAPQQQQQHHTNGLSPALQHSLYRAGLISTATASAASFENTTTTFIKVHASSRSGKLYLQDDEDENRSECYYNGGCQYEDCRETSNGCAISTDEEYGEEDEYDLETEDDDEEDFDDEEYDEFNGLGRKRPQHRHQRRQHTTSRRYRLLAKDAIVARRTVSGNDTTHPAKAAGPGVLWQVYTAVTGVKELIAWYGSMVYHSSSL